MAVMITYGSYLRKEENLAKNTAMICGFSTLTAFLAGFMIIPAVFAAGVDPGKGSGFAFVSLATVFQYMPAGVFFGTLFYVLLFFAAITSSMSLMESVVAALTERMNIGRTKATIGVAAIMFIISIFYTISQISVDIRGIWFDFTNGLSFPPMGDFMELLTDRLLIPINGLTACLLLGWVWGAKNGVDEITQNGKFSFRLANSWVFSVKFLAPAAIIIIIIFGLFLGKVLT